MLKKLLSVCCLVIASNAHAAVPLEFFQANLSAPATLTVPYDVSFTMTKAMSNGMGINFVIEDAHQSDPAWSITSDFNSVLYFSINGGTPTAVNALWSNGAYTSNDMAAVDAYLIAHLSSAIEIGDIITLKAGTTSANVNDAFQIPSTGNYGMFISDQFGHSVSTEGVADSVPEPATYALVGLGLAGAALLRRRK